MAMVCSSTATTSPAAALAAQSDPPAQARPIGWTTSTVLGPLGDGDGAAGGWLEGPPQPDRPATSTAASTTHRPRTATTTP
jgi:hypothetical protein